MSMGETQTFTYAKRFADPDYVAQDWFLSRQQLVRVPYQVLVYPLVKSLPLHIAAITARLLGYLFVAIAIGLLAGRLRINALFVSMAMVSYVAIGQSLLPGHEWIFELAESKTIAYGLALLALYFVVDSRFWVAGALLGLATTMHVLVGGWLTVAMVLVVLFYCKPTTKEFILAGVCWLIAGSFAIYSLLNRLLESNAFIDTQFQHLWTFFRNIHYINVSNWHWLSMETALVVVLAIGLWRLPKLYPERREYLLVSRFALFTLVPFIGGLLVFPFQFGTSLLQLLPFRVADTMIPLIGFMLLIPFVFKPDVFTKLRVPLAVGLLVVGIVKVSDGLELGMHQLSDFPVGAYWKNSKETKQIYEICQWVQRETPPGSRIIASPMLNIIPYLCERPVVVSFRDVPTRQADIAEWYRRLIDFNGGSTPAKRGYAAGREIDKKFSRLRVRDYRHLGEKYNGRYLLVNRKTRLDLPRLMKVGNWYLYELK